MREYPLGKYDRALRQPALGKKISDPEKFSRIDAPRFIHTISAMSTSAARVSEPRPGQAIVDRYMPGATAEEREAAQARLYRLVALIIRHNQRLLTEDPRTGIRANRSVALDLEYPRLTI